MNKVLVMSSLQKIGGVAALFQATIYISAFVFFGAFWDYPVSADDAQKLVFLTDNQSTLSIVNLTMYVALAFFWQY